MVLADSFYYQPVQIDTINTRVNADLFAKEGDANGRGMVVQITENGIIKDTTGITLRLQWSHISVGVSGFTDFEVVDATKGLYKLQYPTSMLHRGRVEAFIRITDNGILAGTRNLLITVERMVGSDETIEAADDFSALQTALSKLSTFEATYRQELVSLGSQLADIDSRVDLLNRGLGETFATLVALQTAYPTGDTKDHIVAADGHRYYWNDVAWADGGAYQAVEVIDNAVTTNKINTITPKWYDMLTLGTITNPGSMSSYDVNNKVVLQTTGSIGMVKLELTSDDVNIVGKLDTNTGLYWGKVIVITDSTDTFLRWEGVVDVETVRDPFLSYDEGTKKFGVDVAVLKQSYPTASRIYLAYTPQFTPIIYRKLHLSQFTWLQPIETAEVKDEAITQSKIKIDEEFVLPAIIPCVVGHEMNCYWENALLYGRINAIQKIDTEYSLFNSERFRDRFIWKPTAVNSTAMKVMLWKKSLKQIDESKVLSFKSVSATAGTGTKKALIIGDSKTAYGQIVRELKALFDADTTMDVEYLGTRYDNNNTGDVTYKHEGRGGWSVSDYVRVASKGGLINPFYNVTTFDFPNYMTTQAYTGVDYVIINLSTNDQGRLIADVVADLNTMIASIKAYSSAIKVIVCLTEGVYRNKMEWDTRNTWYIELKKLMIATYDKREAEKIYVCPLYLNMDLYEDYNLTSVPLSSEDSTKTRLMTADGIHQNQAGFNKNANTMYYTMKYIESLG